MRWVEKIVSEGGYTSEIHYEVSGDTFDLSIRSGPQRGRKGEAEGLFKGSIFLLVHHAYLVAGGEYPDEVATQSDMKLLLGLGGGKVVTDVNDCEGLDGTSLERFVLIDETTSLEGVCDR